MLSTVYFG